MCSISPVSPSRNLHALSVTSTAIQGPISYMKLPRFILSELWNGLFCICFSRKYDHTEIMSSWYEETSITDIHTYVICPAWRRVTADIYMFDVVIQGCVVRCFSRSPQEMFIMSVAGYPCCRVNSPMSTSYLPATPYENMELPGIHIRVITGENCGIFLVFLWLSEK